MGRATKIEWCDHTFNPWRGCQRVSEGCRFCYAELLSKRNPAVLGEWAGGKRVIASEQYWRTPLNWNALAAKHNTRGRVFCLSMGDVWENLPELIEPRSRLFNLIRFTRHLDWLLLTKRPMEAWNALTVHDRFHLFFDDKHISRKNVLRIMQERVWHGVSIEHQAAAEERIPVLLHIPACKRFLSVEPLLNFIDLEHLKKTRNQILFTGEHLNCLTTNENWTTRNSIGKKIDWVIVGGESGHHARPMHPQWASQIWQQCDRHQTPFLFKQWGEWVPEIDCLTKDKAVGSKLKKYFFADESMMVRVGKKKAGRLLYGIEHNEFPVPEAKSATPLAGVADASEG